MISQLTSHRTSVRINVGVYSELYLNYYDGQGAATQSAAIDSSNIDSILQAILAELVYSDGTILEVQNNYKYQVNPDTGLIQWIELLDVVCINWWPVTSPAAVIRYFMVIPSIDSVAPPFNFQCQWVKQEGFHPQVIVNI